MNIINNYVENILKKQLESYELRNNSIILDDVKRKMLSLLSHWKDTEFRNAILITGIEEAEFYEPNANSYLKAFIVLTLRNTFIESAGSDTYQKYDFEIQITDKQMCEITKKAIIYFKNYSLEELSLKIDFRDDYYKRISEKYPIAFELLKKLGALKKRELYFEPIKINEKSVLLPYSDLNIKNSKEKVIEDGMTLELNDKLIYALRQAVEIKELGFFTDCFKFLTRNYEKLLRTLQYLIENNTTFCTFNYYISNGYIAKRNTLLRASHKSSDLLVKFKKNNELTSKHKRCLENWKEVYLPVKK